VQNARMYRRAMRSLVIVHIALCFFERASLRNHVDKTWIRVVDGMIVFLYLVDLMGHSFWDLLYWDDYVEHEVCRRTTLIALKERQCRTS
jgi:hypothetical protein